MGLILIINCGVIQNADGLGSKAILRTRPAAVRRFSQFPDVGMIVIVFLLISDQVDIALKLKHQKVKNQQRTAVRS